MQNTVNEMILPLFLYNYHTAPGLFYTTALKIGKRDSSNFGLFTQLRALGTLADSQHSHLCHCPHENFWPGVVSAVHKDTNVVHLCGLQFPNDSL